MADASAGRQSVGSSEPGLVQNSESQDWPALDEPGRLADLCGTSLAVGLAALGQQQDFGVSAGQQGLHPGNDSAFLPGGASAGARITLYGGGVGACVPCRRRSCRPTASSCG